MASHGRSDDQSLVGGKRNEGQSHGSRKWGTRRSLLTAGHGLPIIRTSVDHGTVFGKAGKGTADETSLRRAVKAALLAKGE